jgi:CheY-like chemotaxis protein
MANILIVDDVPQILRLLCIMLSRNNHTAITALDGEEALEKLRETAVDLMITDINMPQMDGLTLMKIIQSDEQLRNLPIIVMTASIQTQLNLMANGEENKSTVLTQPITSRELNEAVSRCLNQPVCAD